MGISAEKDRLRELLSELERISRALRDPSLAEDGLKTIKSKKSA